MAAIRIGFVLLDGYALMSLAAAVEPLRAANLLAGDALYDVIFVSLSAPSARASAGATFETVPLFQAGMTYSYVFVVAGGNPFDVNEPQLAAWLRRLDRSGVRLGGISGGAAILFTAGLLDQRRFTIHWHHYDALLELFPDALMERRIFVIDRDRYTCAGGVAPLDMMYAMITADHGVTFARAVSDWLLHTQIRAPQDPQRAGLAAKYELHHPVLAAALTLMESHIADPLDVSQLADLCAISPRHLHRLFQQHLGKSLSAFYTELRIAKAKELLQQTQLPIAEVGIATGFPNQSHFTRAFRTLAGCTPAAYRKRT